MAIHYGRPAVCGEHGRVKATSFGARTARNVTGTYHVPAVSCRRCAALLAGVPQSLEAFGKALYIVPEGESRSPWACPACGRFDHVLCNKGGK